MVVVLEGMVVVVGWWLEGMVGLRVAVHLIFFGAHPNNDDEGPKNPFAPNNKPKTHVAASARSLASSDR